MSKIRKLIDSVIGSIEVETCDDGFGFGIGVGIGSRQIEIFIGIIVITVDF
jgi:hypothetical protein